MEKIAGRTAKLVIEKQKAKNRGVCILLNGSVGVGKSVFARGFIREFVRNPEEIVPSPSYLLEQEYMVKNEDGESKIVRHFDFYRLEGMNQTDWMALGLNEALTNDVCLIEWPNKGACFLQNHASTTDFVTVNIQSSDKDIENERSRVVEVEGLDIQT